VVDTTGAGDAFTAALAWALAEGHDLEEAVRLAATAGALACREVGARGSLPTRDEVEGFVAAPPPAPERPVEPEAEEPAAEAPADELSGDPSPSPGLPG
jgi:bifunctional ADP-heptose synthase (sugar kinase/adenylyltransferase)